LHNVHKLEGKIVSVTTDGFITNLEDLENLILEKCDCFIFKEFKKMRELLSGSDKGLEIKTNGVGIIS